jgi:hypothetical protein
MRFVNVMAEMVTNTLTQDQRLFALKRNGYSQYTQPPLGAATGRGCFYWEDTGAVYSVFGDTLYKGTTSIGTLNTSTGVVSFRTSTPLLLWSKDSRSWTAT